MNVGMHDGSVFSAFLCVVVVDVVSYLEVEDVLCGLLCADDLVLMVETSKGLMNMFRG